MTWGLKGLLKRALELPGGEITDVAPAGRARIRYNETTGELESSVDGAAYGPLVPASAGPWERVGTDVYPDSTTWNVTIGAAAVVGSEKLRVTGGEVRFESGLTLTGGSIDLDPTGPVDLEMDTDQLLNVVLAPRTPGTPGSAFRLQTNGAENILAVASSSGTFGQITIGGGANRPVVFPGTNAQAFQVQGNAFFSEPVQLTKEIDYLESASDPTNVNNHGYLYCKEDGARTELYYREGNSGDVTQLTNPEIAAYTTTNVSTDRSFDADTVAIAELADVVGTLIADLQAYGLLG